MAGTANIERRYFFRKESTPGTLEVPSSTRKAIGWPLNTLNMAEEQLRSPVFALEDRGQRTALSYDGVNYSGDSSGSFLHGALDTPLETLLQNAFRTTPSLSQTGQTDGTAAIGDTSVTLDSIHASVRPGHVALFAGHMDKYVILAKTSTSITISPPLKAAVADNAVVTFEAPDILINGESPQAFSLEQRFPEGQGSSTIVSKRFAGVEAVSGNITFESGSAVQATMNLIARSLVIANTAWATGNAVEERGGEDKIPISSGVGVTELKLIAGTDATNVANIPSDVKFTSLSIDFNQEGRDPQRVLTSNDLQGITLGAYRPEVTARMFLDSGYQNILRASQNLEEFAISCAFGTRQGNNYHLYLPRCQFGSITEEQGETGPMFVNIPISPLMPNNTVDIDPSATGGLRGTMRIIRNL